MNQYAEDYKLMEQMMDQRRYKIRYNIEDDEDSIDNYEQEKQEVKDITNYVYNAFSSDGIVC